MNSNPLDATSTPHWLTVACLGRIELPEDCPWLGTYWTHHAAKLGCCTDLDAAITLAECSITQPPLTLISARVVRGFQPERMLIRDSESRLVLAGEIHQTYLVWLPPITSDDETYTLRAAAKRLREEAGFERGWDNPSTADGLVRRAEFLEGHLVDPLWQAQVTQTLKSRAPLGLTRRYSGPRDDAFDDFDAVANGQGDGPMEATSKGWSERRNVIGHVLKFGLLIQRVRIPPDQSVDPQAGSEPCSGMGDCPVDA
jgi:hypothetical protein